MALPPETRAQSPKELHRRLDLRLANGHALDVDADWQVLFTRVVLHVGEYAFAQIDGALQRVGRMAQLVFQPSWERDAEPLHELERAHRAAWREREHYRRRRAGARLQ